MLEILLKLPFSAVFNIVQFALGRPRLKILCGFSWHPNKVENKNNLVFWIKIINPTKNSIFIERIEAKDSQGEIFFPMVINSIGNEIHPQSNIVVLIPYGHISNTSPKVISIIDSTEKYYLLRGKKLKKTVEALKIEIDRLNTLGFQIPSYHD